MAGRFASNKHKEETDEGFAFYRHVKGLSPQELEELRQKHPGTHGPLKHTEHSTAFVQAYKQHYEEKRLKKEANNKTLLFVVICIFAAIGIFLLTAPATNSPESISTSSDANKTSSIAEAPIKLIESEQTENPSQSYYSWVLDDCAKKCNGQYGYKLQNFTTGYYCTCYTEQDNSKFWMRQYFPSPSENITSIGSEFVSEE